MNTTGFLSAVWPATGLYCIATPNDNVKGYRHRVFDNIRDTVAFAKTQGAERNVFFCVHTLKEAKVWDPEKRAWNGTLGAYVYRTQANMREAKCFFFDLDVGQSSETSVKYGSRDEALSDLQRFLFLTGLPQPIVTSSGGGFHVYWPFTTPIASTDWKPIAARLHALAKALGVKHDPMRTTDQSSVLRVPGTFNHKGNQKRPVQILFEGLETDNDAFTLRLEAASLRYVVPVPIRPQSASHMADAPDYIRAANDEESNIDAGGFTGAITTFKSAYRACAQLRAYVAGRRTASQTLWYNMLGLLRPMRYGARLIHRYSRDYPGYVAGDTEAAAERFLKASEGNPPTCDKLQSITNNKACQGCPFYQKVKNPLIAGNQWYGMQPAAAPTLTPANAAKLDVSTLIDAPLPYIRVKRDGGQVQFAKFDKETKTTTNITILHYDMFPVADFERTENEFAFSKWAVKGKNFDQKIIDLPNSTIYDLSRLKTELPNWNIAYSPKNLPEVQMYMTAYIRRLQEHTRAHRQYDHLGWTDKRTKFVMPTETYCVDGSITPSVLSKLAASGTDMIGSAGSRQGSFDALTFYAKDDFLSSQWAILCALASPLFALMDMGGVTLSLSGQSGRTKSTTLYAGGSLWGKPTKYVIDATASGTTTNFRNNRMITLANLPFLLDELTLIAPEAAREFALHGTQFADKGTMKPDRTERAPRSEDKSLVQIVTTNASIQNLLSIDNPSGLATAFRVLEVEMPLVDKSPASKALADKFISDINQNYGWLGPEFLRTVIPHMDKVGPAILNARAHFDKRYGFSPQERYYSALNAVAMGAGRIACNAKAPILPFDLKRIGEWVGDVMLPYARGVIREETKNTSPITTLTNFIEASNANIVRVEPGDTNNNSPFTMQTHSFNDLRGHLDTGSKTLWIRKDAFRDWCVHKNKNATAILHQLRAVGLVSRDVKFTLGKGTVHAKTRSICFTVNLAEEVFSGIAKTAPVVTPAGSNVVPLARKKAL
jgi:hypothetical protein